MDLKLNVSKKGLSTQEEVINEEYTLRYGHIFRGKSAYEYAVEGGFVGSEEEYEAYVGNIGNLSEEAKEATIEAKEAVIGAQDAREQALVAADMASSAGTRADKATENAENATQTALDAAERANKAAENAESSIITIDKELSPTSDNAIANSAVVNGLAGLAEGVSTTIGQVSEQLGAEIETKAAKDGYYPDMSVGMADNLIGRGDVQDAHINFRPSAGADNITDGAARIERIKGNSVVWNQGYPPKKVVIDIDNSSGTSAKVVYLKADSLFYSKANSYYYCAVANCKFNHSSTIIYNGYLSSQTIDLKSKPSIIYSNADRTSVISLYAQVAAGVIEHIECEPIVVNLTQMFGAGNEPTSYEEYLQRKPMNIEDEFAYNAGELIDMKVDSLVSVGDNAWDEEWENGAFDTTTGTNINNTHTNKQIRSKNLIKVLPNTNYTCTIPAKIGNDSIWCMLLDKNKEVITGYTVPNAGISGNSFGLKIQAPSFTTPANAVYLQFYCSSIYGDVYTNDICFHLEQSGYKNGKYYPYQQDVKDLSFISEAFPEGMRSAGSVFDEIRFNPTKNVWEKVERVGVRAYAEGDAENSSVTTDGETTNYPLDSPMPTTIDLSPNFSPDYPAWDFGTEEAIASVPSTPFRADIQYGDNFVDDIRKNKDDIATNKANIAKNASAINSKQDTLTLTTKPNGNIVLLGKEFMPATPSGDPMHYAYESLGGLYNASGSDIAFIGVYGETITHKSNHWRLNDLGDLSNEEMQKIFNMRYPSVSGFYLPMWFGGNANVRTNICSTNWTSSHDMNDIFVNNSSIESVSLAYSMEDEALPRNLAYAFFAAPSCHTIINEIDLTYATLQTSTFGYCYSLKNIRLLNLHSDIVLSDSPLLSKESLLFMINNCASNAKFTITLHSDVYAKCTRVDEGEGQYIGEWWNDIDDALGGAVELKNTNITLASA